MQAKMLVQALNVARANYVSTTVEGDHDYEALPPSAATMRAHRLVGEIIEHCDVLARRSSAGGGGAAERRQRARRALQRMDSSPACQVRARNERGSKGHAVDRDGDRTIGGGHIGNPTADRGADRCRDAGDMDTSSMMETEGHGGNAPGGKRPVLQEYWPLDSQPTKERSPS